jgi:hypothetical protein
MDSATQQAPESHTLIERLSCDDALAYGWDAPRPDGSGLSNRYWLVYLPEHDERSIDDDENPNTGVFAITGLLNGARRILIAEAHDPEADASLPGTVTRVTTQFMLDASDTATLPHLLREVALDIIQGVFSPFSGPVEQDAQRDARHAAHYANLLARAEAAQKGA